MKHALKPKEAGVFKQDFYPKEKAKQEKPKHEFAFTVVLSLHLAGRHFSYWPFKIRHPVPSSMFTNLTLHRSSEHFCPDRPPVHRPVGSYLG